LERFKEAGIVATYFVDPMFGAALGRTALEDVVGRIVEYGQGVGLHIHPEWLSDPRVRGLPPFRGPYLWQYEEKEQEALIAYGRETLEELGARPLVAFRAGSFGADERTLRALARQGFRIDSSLNAAFDVSFATFADRDTSAAAFPLHGVTEVPVTRFSDRLTGVGKPLHLVAVGAGEFIQAIGSAARMGITSACLVMHGSEFVRTERVSRSGRCSRRRIVLRRFDALCEYLGSGTDGVTTARIETVLADAELEKRNNLSFGLPRVSVVSTARRLVEQTLARWI
jgi:hypothetical protein